MSLAIRRLIEGGDLSRERVDAFLAEHGSPIVEGSTVTFLFRGTVDAVYLQHWIYGLPSAQRFERVDGSDLWYLVQEIPARSRVEYKLEVHEGDTARLIRDPLNDELAHDPFGANSVCRGSGYRDPEWVEPDPETRAGSVEPLAFRSKALDREVEATIYLPARFRATRRYPLLVVHDGIDYLRFAALQTVLDNLIHGNEVASMVVALIQSPVRLREYAADERHGRMVVEELLPRLEQRYPLAPERESRGLMGASFGAVAAFATAARHPDRFGSLLLQSGSFAFTDIGPSKRGPAFEPVVEFVNRYREAPARVADRIYMTCGVYESLIYENRSFVPLLQQTGMDVRYVEAWDGHNWENWRDRLREGLSWLFPGPLWMFYE